MDGHEQQPQTTFKRRGGPLTVVIVSVLVLGVGATVAWFMLQRPQPEVVVAPPPEVAPVDAGVAEVPLDAEASQATIAQWLNEHVVPPELKAWLSAPEVVRRAAAAVYAVAEGDSPREVLSFMQPAGEFSVRETRGTKRKPGKVFIDEKSYARYDRIAEVIGSLDAQAAGRLYAGLRVPLQAAFREISPPGQTFDAAFVRAVDRLAAVPLQEGPVQVVLMPKGVTYAFVDEKLEQRPPAEKHLLRMGPKNAHLVVKQLQAFRAAIAAGEVADAGQ